MPLALIRSCSASSATVTPAFSQRRTVATFATRAVMIPNKSRSNLTRRAPAADRSDCPSSQQAILETEVPVLRHGTCSGDHVRHQILKCFPEQEILRIEIEIQALPGDSRCLRDVIHGCLLEAVPQEGRCRGL